MIELLVITSLHSKVPLAEIRTDGKNIDWIVDNSNGKLVRMASGDFSRLKSIVDKSSHLKMEKPEEATVGMLRYMLENGDVVEITTDGKTAQLNGELMPEEEKFGLMSAIASGKIKVKTKANISTPLQLIPKPKPPKKEVPVKHIDDKTIAAISRHKDKDKNRITSDNRYRDSKIDSVDFSGSECPEMGRQLLYLLKYGEDDA